ncbi:MULTISPECIES: GNAT family N-acetyltransferase [unclassified Arthrobacter]|uniref:GNAT family N-acetyltransferase n=1 Tax=unclassified Arthrobacter TaxID=235627 RepID=UPI0033941705
MTTLWTKRLVRGDLTVARDMFAMMAAVLAEDAEPLTDDYLLWLLDRDSFWAIAAFAGDDIVGGITAHTLPMTRSPSSEVFIYDLAVRQDHQRQGVGSRLVLELRDAAAAAGFGEVFVPADNEDKHALDFYQAQGAAASPVTIFTFTAR